jgi:hypothetical protein
VIEKNYVGEKWKVLWWDVCFLGMQNLLFVIQKFWKIFLILLQICSTDEMARVGWNGHEDRQRALLFETLRKTPLGWECLMEMDDDEFFDNAVAWVRSKQRRFELVVPHDWSLDEMDDGFLRNACRFQGRKIEVLARWFLGERLVTKEQDNVPATMGMYLFLRLMATGNRVADVAREVRKHPSTTTRIFHAVYERFLVVAKRVFMNFDEQYIKDNWNLFTSSIEAVSGYHSGVYGFLDGTLVYIPIPSKLSHEGRRSLFGRKKANAGINYQVLVLPTGIAFYISRPFIGSRHDSRAFTECGVYPNIRRVYEWGAQTNNAPLSIYADRGYGRAVGLMRAAKDPERAREPQLANFHSAMHTCRSEIEHFIGHAKTNFDILGVFRKLKPRNGAVNHFYVAMLLYNFMTCADGSNQVTDKFQTSPPTFHDYLRYVFQHHDAEFDD